MKFLNLSQGFNPFNASPQEMVACKVFEFPGGEIHCQLIDDLDFFDADEDQILYMTHRVRDSRTLMEIVVTMDAISRALPHWEVLLYLPYFPGARQDRVSNFGEPLSAVIYADIINSCRFNGIFIMDPHSDVITSQIHNVIVADNHSFLKAVIDDIPEDHSFLIVPDGGALKKAFDIHSKFDEELLEMVVCHKHRDTLTGNISGFGVFKEDLHKMPCIIFDDICDGGGTFLGLYKELKIKNAGPVYLAVTHGIFSKGTALLTSTFESVYCTDSFYSQEDLGEVKVIQIEERHGMPV